VRYNSIGGGGQLDSSVNAKANTALYTTFAVVGFTAGSFLNYCIKAQLQNSPSSKMQQLIIWLAVGAKSTLAFGGFGYAVYSASYLSYNHTKNEGFVVFAGALLGVCAAFLWCAQGTVMMVCLYFLLYFPTMELTEWITGSLIPLNQRRVGSSDYFGVFSISALSLDPVFHWATIGMYYRMLNKNVILC
jgi:hypothetical protein